MIDSEIIFEFPTKISELEPFVSFESGQTAPTKLSDGAYAVGLALIDPKTTMAVSVGRQNQLSDGQRILYNNLNSELFELSQSPIDLMWSHKNNGQIFAVGLFYSNHNDKLNQIGESTQILRAGYRSGFLTLSGSFELINDVSATANKKLNIYDAASVSVLYEIDTLTLSGSIENFSAAQKNSGLDVSAIENQNISLAFSDRTDFNGSHFFYRIDVLIKNTKFKTLNQKEHENQIPMTLGIESEFSDWLVLRSSLKQTLLISQFESIPASENNTQAAFGAGFKFKNIILDGALSGLIGSAQTGALDGNQFLSQVGITASY